YGHAPTPLDEFLVVHGESEVAASGDDPREFVDVGDRVLRQVRQSHGVQTAARLTRIQCAQKRLAEDWDESRQGVLVLELYVTIARPLSCPIGQDGGPANTLLSMWIGRCRRRPP